MNEHPQDQVPNSSGPVFSYASGQSQIPGSYGKQPEPLSQSRSVVVTSTATEEFTKLYSSVCGNQPTHLTGEILKANQRWLTLLEDDHLAQYSRNGEELSMLLSSLLGLLAPFRHLDNISNALALLNPMHINDSRQYLRIYAGVARSFDEFVSNLAKDLFLPYFARSQASLIKRKYFLLKGIVLLVFEDKSDRYGKPAMMISADLIHPMCIATHFEAVAV